MAIFTELSEECSWPRPRRIVTVRGLAIAAAVVVAVGVVVGWYGQPLAGLAGALRWSPPVSQAQSALLQLGFDPGRSDGTLGPQTRRAIGAFQASHGLPATGHLNRRTWKVLCHQAGIPATLPAPAPSTAATTNPAPSAPAPSTPAAAAPPAPIVVPAEPLTPYRIRRLQKALARAGFDPGKIDGSLGQRTRDAFVAFQRSKKLAPTGTADAPTMAALKRFLPRESKSSKPSKPAAKSSKAATSTRNAKRSAR